MSTTQGTVALIVSACLISFPVAGALIYIQGGPAAGADYNSLAEKTEFTQGLKALEIVMKVSDRSSQAVGWE